MRDYLIDILSAAMLAGLLQNIVLAGGLGITEAVRMAAKPQKLLRCTGFVALFSVSVTLICRALDMLPVVKNRGMLFHAVLFAGVLAVVYLASIAVAAVLKCTALTKRRISVCALNSLVLSLPYISYKSAFTFAEAAGLALGAAGSYLLAVFLLNMGLERLWRNDTIPEVFRGNGALFMYMAILSLAFAGMTGARLAL